jgi:hypothetical protein
MGQCTLLRNERQRLHAESLGVGPSIGVQGGLVASEDGVIRKPRFRAQLGAAATGPAPTPTWIERRRSSPPD